MVSKKKRTRKKGEARPASPGSNPASASDGLMTNNRTDFARTTDIEKSDEASDAEASQSEFSDTELSNTEVSDTKPEVAATLDGQNSLVSTLHVEKKNAGNFFLVLLLFLASGLSSLIYQVVWTRELVLVFGATTFATSTVLAIFMGGLALGSYAAGRIADKLERPLLVYGILEGIIGIWALIAPLLFTLSTPIYSFMWQHTHASMWVLSLLRFVVATAILLVPTTCMGATLPILSRFVTSSLDYVGNRVGTLYAINTCGAICGSFIAGFVFMPLFGLRLTTTIAAVINFLLLGISFSLNRMWKNASRMEHSPSLLNPDPVSKEQTEAKSKEESEDSPSDVLTSTVLVVFALSGAIAMVYEVCWTRALLLIIGSSTYAFTIMLTAFLTGIFLGSILASRFADRLQFPFVWLAIVQMYLGILTLGCTQAFNLIPTLSANMSLLFLKNIEVGLMTRYLVSGIVLIPITLCLGAVFPIVVRCCTSNLSNVGRSIGSLYAANTLGAIVGAFSAGFFLLPICGAERTLLWCAAANFSLGFVLVAALFHQFAVVRNACIVICGLCLLFATFIPNIWDHVLLSVAQAERRDLRTGKGQKSVNAEEWQRKYLSQAKLLFWADGACSNVSVLDFNGGIRLTTNGHVDASDAHDKAVQALLSAFPLLVRPKAEDLVVVGWGSGQTIGTALQFPIRSIDAVELEPEVIKASTFFHHINRAPELDPRVHIQFNDGRNFLLATNKTYDMVISEPSNPWQAGVCNLFTREYFEICRRRLKRGGMFVLWMQYAEVPPQDLNAVFAGLKQTYPHVIAFQPLVGNLILLASLEPIVIDYPQLMETFKSTNIAGGWPDMGIVSPDTFLGRLVIADDGFENVNTLIANTDDRNRLEFDVAKSYEEYTYFVQNFEMLNKYRGSPWKQIDWGKMSKSDTVQAFTSIAKEALTLNHPELCLAWARASNQLEENARSYRLCAAALATKGDKQAAMSMVNRSLSLDGKEPRTIWTRGMIYQQTGKFDLARRDFDRVLEIEPSNPNNRVLAASGYLAEMPRQSLPPDKAKDGDPNATKIISLIGALADTPYARTDPDILWALAQAHFRLRHFRQAEHYAGAYFNMRPNDAEDFGGPIMEIMHKEAQNELTVHNSPAKPIGASSNHGSEPNQQPPGKRTEALRDATRD